MPRPRHHGHLVQVLAVFGATTEVAACGLPEIKDHALLGTSGLASIRRYLALPRRRLAGAGVLN